MADIEKLRKTLIAKGFETSYFATKAEAADYLDSQLDGKTIGMGGSMTIQELGLVERLKTHNQVIAHWLGSTLQETTSTQVYLSSLNGVAETGELINIDGIGNRVASGLFGHEKIYFIIGVNKIAADYPSALWRARNIAAPKNAQRLGKSTPCAVKGDKCYDCNSPQRICCAMVTYWCKPHAMECEVVIVGEELGL